MISGMEWFPEEIWQAFQEQKNTLGGCRPQLGDIAKMLQAITSPQPAFSVPNRPGARRGPAGGLPRAPDGTGRLAVVRPVRPKGRTAVFG